MTAAYTPLTDAELAAWLQYPASLSHTEWQKYRAAAEIRALRRSQENQRLWLANATAQLDRTRVSEARLLAALKRVLDNHCANDRVFCGSCTEARKLLSAAEGRAE